MKRRSKKSANKKLPSKKQPLHNTRREADKTFLIAIISIIAVVALFLLLLFSGQLVGKAFFQNQPNNAGIVDPGVILEGKPFSLKVQVNIPTPSKTNAVGFTLQLPTVSGVADVCSKIIDVDNDASNGINIKNLFGDYVLDNKCENNKIIFGSGLTNGDKSGTVTVAQIDFQGLPKGFYSFTFIGQFEAYDEGIAIAITILNPTIEIQEQSKSAMCGNNQVETGEECDDGNLDNADACIKNQLNQCKNAICGDGYVRTGMEQCDDSNIKDGDGCSSTCELESNALCGDNVCNVKFESTSSCAQDCGLICPTNGLVSWWKGENNAQDSYKFGHNAVFTGNAAYTPGIVDQSFKFDGVDDLLDLGKKEGTLFADPTNSSLSLSFWMKTSATKSPQGSMYIIDTGAGTDGRRGFYCNTVQGTLYCAVRQAKAIYKASSSNIIPLNSWKHVTLTFDDNAHELKLYLDGALSKTGTEEKISGDTFASPLAVIGATATNPKNLLFNGSLDEIAVWNRALAAAEVKNLYNAGAVGMCSISSFVCGNNVQEAGEECDEGDNIDGDGCSSICQKESAICGDNVCEIKFESTTSCPQDCGQVCPTNGLVSWWNGNDAQDSFSSHHGTLGGNANIFLGKVGNAFYFDGDGDSVNLGQKPGTIFSDPTGSSLSVSFWMRTNATKSPQGALYILDSGAGTASRRGFYCSTNQGMLNCAIKHTNTIYQVSANNAIPLNVWKFVTFTFDQSKEELKLYVDGFSSATGTKATLSSSSSPVPMSVIGATNLQTLSFNGSLDEIVVWNRALTPLEVRAIFDTGGIGMCAVPQATCGNSFVETGEECDDGNVINTDACTSQCDNAVCGDGIIRIGIEQCEGSNLAEASCQTLGFANGSLSCTAGCMLNNIACIAAPPPPPPPVNVSFTVNGTKISLGEITPANNTFFTKITATESFSSKLMVYTILYDATGKVLALEIDEITGGMAKDASYIITVNHLQAEVKKKSVLVFDIEPNPTIFGQLEGIYH